MSGEELVAADLLRMIDDERRLNQEVVELPFWRFARRERVRAELDVLRLMIPRVMLTLIITKLEIVEAIPALEPPPTDARPS